MKNMKLFVFMFMSVLCSGLSEHFIDVALERFESRNNSIANDNWSFDRLQLVRIPKAGSTEASVLARLLGGCYPTGPCCVFPGDPIGSCPSKNLECPSVSGCTGHYVNADFLEKGSSFSMSNMRGVVDRVVSGFFYSAPHSPKCTKDENVNYEECFLRMTEFKSHRNVMSKMVTGHYAYDGKNICVHEEDDCDETLKSVIRGACNLNFVTILESWQSSILLLFETLPWIKPNESFFPLKDHNPYRSSNKKHIELITNDMRTISHEANIVDVYLYEFVSAKFCESLEKQGLMNYPLVLEELEINNICGNWVQTLQDLEYLTPIDCRLYNSMN